MTYCDVTSQTAPLTSSISTRRSNPTAITTSSFKSRDGTRAAAQIEAFGDTWEWNTESAADYQEVVEAGGDVANAMRAFKTLLGDTGTDMQAYLAMMAPRLVELRRVLKPTGTIYLHCDATASAHLRLLMDAVFGSRNFLNEIIWHYQTSSGAPKKWLHRNHDVILRYAAFKPDLVKWHHPRVPWPEATLKKWQTDEQGRIYRVQNKFKKRYYVDPAGKLDDDAWEITLSSRTRERLRLPDAEARGAASEDHRGQQRRGRRRP